MSRLRRDPKRKVGFPPATLRWFMVERPWGRLDEPEIVRTLGEMLREDPGRLRTWVVSAQVRPAHRRFDADGGVGRERYGAAASAWWFDATGEVIAGG